MKSEFRFPRTGDGISADALARGLGWFSIGIGIAEVLLKKSASRPMGLPARPYGVREIANGIALLSAKNPTPWIWARVGGDVLDLVTVAARGRGPVGAAALVAIAGATVVDVVCATKLRTQSIRPRAPARDYSGRSGLPLPIEQMRGAARRPMARAAGAVQATG